MWALFRLVLIYKIFPIFMQFTLMIFIMHTIWTFTFLSLAVISFFWIGRWSTYPTICPSCRPATTSWTSRTSSSWWIRSPRISVWWSSAQISVRRISCGWCKYYSFFIFSIYYYIITIEYRALSFTWKLFCLMYDLITRHIVLAHI